MGKILQILHIPLKISFYKIHNSKEKPMKGVGANYLLRVTNSGYHVSGHGGQWQYIIDVLTEK